ncbi:uncharacterized protein LOC133507897 isoform X2 [Syngnathoides biaculeatus]|uniref:uncharacterized protein LOC133507897 isoform X2 n=1 Tax=Syngnathoides biaculeatus TaxID=300417 RepID=UPI002ADDD0F0|nr:uncharacterized protein LOC133507897 isoform X2 [Syngnathoides biaculeatus]
MFPNASSEGRLPAVLSAPPAGLVAQESSWLGLLFVLSRHALSLVSRYLPGLGGEAAPARDRGDFLGRPDAAVSALSRLGEGSLCQLTSAAHPAEPGQNREASPIGTVFARDRQDPPEDRCSAGPADPRSVNSGSAPVQFCSLARPKLTIERQRSVLYPNDSTGESAGTSVHKDKAPVNGGACGIRNLRAGSCPPRSPDRDNGYYSLEEEHSLKGHKGHAAAGALKDTCEKPPARTTRDGLAEKMADCHATGGAVPREVAAADVTPDEMATVHVTPEGTAAGAHVTPEETLAPATQYQTAAPRCRNASIAFIMGCPCSDDDDESQSDADSAHDGDSFDSSSSSDLSSSSSSDEEGDDPLEEAAHLMASLCRHDDPYNPQNFSALLRTGRPPPALRPLASSPPLSSRGPRDDSGSEADEADGVLALASSAPRDPYNLLNFQAPLRTRKATQAPAGARLQPFTSAKKVL